MGSNESRLFWATFAVFALVLVVIFGGPHAQEGFPRVVQTDQSAITQPLRIVPSTAGTDDQDAFTPPACADCDEDSVRIVLLKVTDTAASLCWSLPAIAGGDCTTAGLTCTAAEPFAATDGFRLAPGESQRFKYSTSLEICVAGTAAATSYTVSAEVIP